MTNEPKKSAPVEGPLIFPVAVTVVPIKEEKSGTEILGIQFYADVNEVPMTFLMSPENAKLIRDDLTTWIDRMCAVSNANKVGLLRVDGATTKN